MKLLTNDGVEKIFEVKSLILKYVKRKVKKKEIKKEYMTEFWFHGWAV